MRKIAFLTLIIGLFFNLLSNFAFSKEVKFIQITDINLNTKNAWKLQETIKEINQYNDIDFVVFGGNNIQKADIDNLNTFLYLIKKVNKKVYVLLGSNDVLSSNGITKKYYLERVNKALLFRHPKKPNYVFKCKDYVFITMDGSKQYFQSSNGYYTPQELMWLDKTLTKHKNDDVIILQHFPVYPAKSLWLQTAKMEEYLKVLKKHNNVKMIVSGHYGDNQEVNNFGIYNVITESYSKQGAYKIIQLDLDKENPQNNFIGTHLVK